MNFEVEGVVLGSAWLVGRLVRVEFGFVRTDDEVGERESYQISIEEVIIEL